MRPYPDTGNYYNADTPALQFYHKPLKRLFG